MHMLCRCIDFIGSTSDVVTRFTVSYNNLPEYGITSILSNKYHRVWCTLVAGAKWVVWSSETGAHFSPICDQDYACLVLGCPRSWFTECSPKSGMCQLHFTISGRSLIFDYLKQVTICRKALKSCCHCI